MSQALYRKYRPVRFSDLVGQNHVRVTLENELEKDKVAHAYLFSGPRGVGKTTTARLLAKAVNCQDRKENEACDKCDYCQEINQGKSMDVIEIDAASHTGVDNVRENIIENSRFTPQRLKYKVFIIDEVHMLSLSAFNALLKTLEEPPEHVIFILATTEIHRVPETIISRCQRFDFKRVSVEELVKRMSHIAKEEGVKVEDKLLENVAHRAEGSVRDAEVLLTQLISLGEKEITAEKAELVIPRSNTNELADLYEIIIHKKTNSGIALVASLIEDGVNIPDFVKDFIDFLRRIMVYKSSGATGELENISIDATKLNTIKKLTDKIGLPELLRIIDIMVKRQSQIKNANIIQLPLEMAILEIIGDFEEEVEDDQEDGQKPSSPPSPKKTKPKVQEKKTEKKEATTVPKSALFAKIEDDWLDIIKELREHNHSISMTLKVGVPVSFVDNVLTIGFRYKFHAERIKDNKISIIMENYFEGKYQQKIKIQTEVLNEERFNAISRADQSAVDKENVWDDAIQDLGGELVEEEV